MEEVEAAVGENHTPTCFACLKYPGRNRVGRLVDHAGTSLSAAKVLPVLLPALALLALPVFLILSPIWVAPSRSTEDPEEYRNRYDSDDDEDEQRDYRDAQDETSPYAYEGCRVEPDSSILLKGGVASGYGLLPNLRLVARST